LFPGLLLVLAWSVWAVWASEAAGAVGVAEAVAPSGGDVSAAGSVGVARVAGAAWAVGNKGVLLSTGPP
jgi:hypothetical protein